MTFQKIFQKIKILKDFKKFFKKFSKKFSKNFKKNFQKIFQKIKFSKIHVVNTNTQPNIGIMKYNINQQNNVIELYNLQKYCIFL